MIARTRREGYILLAGCAILVASCVVSTIYYMSIYPSPDQSIFDYIGFLGSIGRPYYKAAFDISWPGPFVYHQIGVELFGAHRWTARLTDALLLPIGVAGLWLFQARAGLPTAAWLAAILYPIIYVTSGYWIAGHRDLVGMHLLILAAALLIDPQRRGGKARIAAGASIGYAVLIRPTYLFAALPFFLIDTRDLRSTAAAGRAFVAYCGGAALVALPFLLGGLWAGSIGDWYEQAILVPLSIYQEPLSRWRLVSIFAETVAGYWLWLSIAAVLGAILWTRDAQYQSWRLYWLTLVATALLSYAVQNKGFVYHASGLIPLLLLSGTIGVEAWRGRRGFGGFALASIGTAATLLLIATAGIRIAHALHPAARDMDSVEAGHIAIARMIAAESPPDAPVLQWGYAYDVPFLARRRSATRYVNTVLLPGISPDDPVLGRWLPIFREEMRRDPPMFVIIDRKIWPGISTGLPLVTQAPVGTATPYLVALLNRDYVVRARTGDLLVLLRKPASTLR